MPLSQFDEQRVYIDLETIDNGWGSSALNVIGHDAFPVRLDSLLLASDDTVDLVVQLWGTFAGTAVTLLGSVLVPAGSGTDGVLPNVDAVPIVFPNQRCYLCNHNFGVGIVSVPAVTAGKKLHATIIGGYF